MVLLLSISFIMKVVKINYILGVLSSSLFRTSFTVWSITLNKDVTGAESEIFQPVKLFPRGATLSKRLKTDLGKKKTIFLRGWLLWNTILCVDEWHYGSQVDVIVHLTWHDMISDNDLQLRSEIFFVIFQNHSNPSLRFFFSFLVIIF